MVAATTTSNNDERTTNKPVDWANVKTVGLEMQHPWAKMLLNGTKTIETRSYPLPADLLGKTIYILESRPTLNNGTPHSCVPNEILTGELTDEDHFISIEDYVTLIGKCTFESCKTYDNYGLFHLDRSEHCVPEESIFDYKSGSVVYGWVVEDVSFIHGGMEITDIRRKFRSLFEIELENHQ